MIKLINILKESDAPRDLSKRVSREINMTQAIEIIQTHCSEAVKVFAGSPGVGKGLYRGYAGGNKYCFYTDPSTRERTGNNNLYNALTSILPSWKKFPQRSRSLMFSNDPSVALTYGMPYWLFPFDQANIAHCIQRDCWYAFEYAGERLGRETSAIDSNLNMFAAEIAKAVLRRRNELDSTSHWTSKAGKHFTNREYTISNTQAFLNELKRITPALLKHCRQVVDVTGERDTQQFSICKDILENFKGDWTQYFDDILDPDKNYMSLITIPEVVNIDKSVEMWTDAKCIMVNPTVDLNFYKMGDSSICSTFFKQKMDLAIGDNQLHLYGIK